MTFEKWRDEVGMRLALAGGGDVKHILYVARAAYIACQQDIIKIIEEPRSPYAEAIDAKKPDTDISP